MERAQSVPAIANPFWSDKVKGDLMVRALRPQELPQTPAEMDGRFFDRPTGEKPGKGHGSNRPTGAGRGCYVTPPSYSKTSEPDSAVPLEGNRSEGVMPPTGSDPVKSMGRVPNGDDDDRNPGELQRALEKELVQHLRAQNTQLMEELETLKRGLAQKGGNSTSSWSEVGRDSTSGGMWVMVLFGLDTTLHAVLSSLVWGIWIAGSHPMAPKFQTGHPLKRFLQYHRHQLQSCRCLHCLRLSWMRMR